MSEAGDELKDNMDILRDIAVDRQTENEAASIAGMFATRTAEEKQMTKIVNAEAAMASDPDLAESPDPRIIPELVAEPTPREIEDAVTFRYRHYHAAGYRLPVAAIVQRDAQLRVAHRREGIEWVLDFLREDAATVYAERMIEKRLAAHDDAVAVARNNAGRNPNGTPAGPFADDHGPGEVAKKETP